MEFVCALAIWEFKHWVWILENGFRFAWSFVRNLWCRMEDGGLGV